MHVGIVHELPYLRGIYLDAGVSNSCPPAYPGSSLSHLPKPTLLLLNPDVAFYLEYHYTLCDQWPPAQNHRGGRITVTLSRVLLELPVCKLGAQASQPLPLPIYFVTERSGRTSPGTLLKFTINLLGHYF